VNATNHHYPVLRFKTRAAVSVHDGHRDSFPSSRCFGLARLRKTVDGRTASADHLTLWLLTFFFLEFLTLEDGTGTLFRNIGKGLPLDAE
jgi:hypothetical protein